ncbi:hypothetical protein BAUCODRAFT_127015 [Baudoinia panamericana UAMH 10762]|uniref:Zn(2)-C6 fungal-type domain-containing protein n=1 Tax=Baudoinia panamericana (strain UAMH 10762) TaxID=717646 RepID=M2LB99_BAUPA|nr:uncharacterized protein BAUCODRAFT_127015 [Baudoinia panamericana UAMH 10762]EMC91097.1 hypothetical protein BAUCODRAFT_127015 [Baudoinia panamericana UAMH 10762]
MYHTFSVVEANGGRHDERHASRPVTSRRLSTINACNECRRRKIRCGGSQPCQQCLWSQHPELCVFAGSGRKTVQNRMYMEQLHSRSECLSAVCSRLFPNQDPSKLRDLPRNELINLAVTLSRPKSAQTPPANDIILPPSVPSVDSSRPSESADSLNSLEQAPERNPVVDEAIRQKRTVHGISDDVNCLSLSFTFQSSYVGISSISAVLKVIFMIAPGARTHVAQNAADTALPSRVPSPSVEQQLPIDATAMPPPDIAHNHIESYFNRVHVLMPMIDEDDFRHTYLYLDRKDGPWLALFNTVLALGSLASGTCADEEHLVYFRRASKHLDYEAFGSANIYVLQALGLLAGYYLHWLNRPNEANALMGATLRMATAVGLHREYSNPSRNVEGQIPVGIRRSTWWSLVCLDTWAAMTTGRPSLGRTGLGVTVDVPKIPEHSNNAQYLASLKLLPLVHNVPFCKLATRIQDRLAAQTLLNPTEIAAFDAELVRWHDELPPILRISGLEQDAVAAFTSPRYEDFVANTSPASAPTEKRHDKRAIHGHNLPACPEILKTPRLITHWWFMTLRILMYRPYLLATSLRRSPRRAKSADETTAIERCRIIAEESIRSINLHCPNELLAGWNAVWLMYQAVMIPLVSLFAMHPDRTKSTNSAEASAQTAAQSGNDNADDVLAWRIQVETAIVFFQRMTPYSMAAKRSTIIVERLYAASKHSTIFTAPPNSTQPSEGDNSRLTSCEITQMSGTVLPDMVHVTPVTGQVPDWLDAGDWGVSDGELLEWTALWSNDVMWDNGQDFILP